MGKRKQTDRADVTQAFLAAIASFLSYFLCLVLLSLAFRKFAENVEKLLFSAFQDSYKPWDSYENRQNRIIIDVILSWLIAFGSVALIYKNVEGNIPTKRLSISILCAMIEISSALIMLMSYGAIALPGFDFLEAQYGIAIGSMSVFTGIVVLLLRPPAKGRDEPADRSTTAD